MTLIRTDQFKVTVTVDGVNLGTWDKFSGGEADSDETKYRPGGMANQVSLGGTTTVGNVTVSKAYDPVVDGARIASLLAARGLKDASVALQPLDNNKAPYGNPIVYSGKLKAVTTPEHDSEGSGAAMISLEISTDGDISA
jgi:hypothetical protein